MTEVKQLSVRPSSLSQAPTMTTSATIVLTTARTDPRLDWLVDGLDAQSIAGDDFELVVVDALGRSLAELGYCPVPCITHAVSVPPKPSVWQGPQRVTTRDFWAASNARNTGIVVARRDYVAFLDDRCQLGHRWLECLRRAARERESVYAGSYDKDDDEPIVDHRRLRFPGGRRGISGNWLYGGSIALPLSWVLEVNGFEEGCDGLAMEDVVFGDQLVNAGYRLDFVADMYVRKIRRGAVKQHGMSALDKGSGRLRKSLVARQRFGRRRRTEFTPDLRILREEYVRLGRFSDLELLVEPVDWYDGQPLREL